MASQSGVSLLSRRQSSASLQTKTMAMRDEEGGADLTRSLKQLSLSTESRETGRSQSRLSLSKPSSSPPGVRTNTTPSPRIRTSPPPRSPSINGRHSRAGTPNLLRKASTNSLRSTNGAAAGPGPRLARRPSSAQMGSPPKGSPSSQPMPDKIYPTANTIARDFFKLDLEMRHSPMSSQLSETVVVLNDAVYGHRFSRPRASRSALNTIVERPERIQAAVLGVAAAYVRLGGRHDEGANPIHEHADVNSASASPFRIHKTSRKLSLQSPAVTNVHGAKWMEELKMMCESAEAKLAMGGKELQRPEMDRGPGVTPAKLHEGDLYLCEESLEAMEGALGAVCEAVDAVFGPGPNRAFVGVRPPGHHCSASFPSGFCWVNNVHVGIMHAILEHGLTHAVIIDFDLHHGDGSQSITWAHNARALSAAKNAAPWKKSSIGYFSLHDINSYPCEQGDMEKVKNASLCIDNAHGQSIWNVHLEEWKNEQDFWRLYETKYAILLEKVRSYLRGQAQRLQQSNTPAKAVIFFSAGFDASEWESAGMQRHKVNVPTEFYARIAQDVVKLAAEEGLHVDSRVISVLEGGYSDRALFSGVLSHLSGLVTDQSTKLSQPAGGLGVERNPEQKLTPNDEKRDLGPVQAYEASWWAASQMDNLDNTIGNPPPPTQKCRNITPPTYCTPTAASTAKVVDPTKMRRSLSGLTSHGAPVRSPTPPPPDVDWTVATYELSRLLIPNDRQIDSYKSEELNAEASRARRDRHSVLMGIPLEPPQETAERPTSRMSLRGKKPKPIPIDEEQEESVPNRRRTVGTSSSVASDKVNNNPRGSTKPTLTMLKASARGVASDTNGEKKGSRRLSGPPAPLSSLDSVSRPPISSSGTRTVATHAIRPATSSGRTNSNAFIQVKKTRAPPSPINTTAGARGPRNTEPPSPSSIPISTSRPGSRSASRQSSQTRPTTADKSGDEIDKITTGVKKIRINLITQSQKEARERARLEVEKTAAVKKDAPGVAPQQQQLTQPIQLASSKMGLPPINTKPDPQVAAGTARYATDDTKLTTAASPDHFIPTPSPSLSSREPSIALPSSGLSSPSQECITPSVGSPQADQHIPISMSASTELSPLDDVFVPYHPDGPAPVAMQQQEPLKWLPPNENPSTTTTPKKQQVTPSSKKSNANAKTNVDNTLFQHGKQGVPFAPRDQKLTLQRSTNKTNNNKPSPQNVKKENRNGP